MVADVKDLIRSYEICQLIFRRLCIAGTRRTVYQARIALWVRLEGVINQPCDGFTVSQVSRIDFANKVLLKNVVNFLLLMNGENVPIWFDTASNRS